MKRLLGRIMIAIGWTGMLLFSILPIRSHELPVIGRVLGWWVSASMWCLHHGSELRVKDPPRVA